MPDEQRRVDHVVPDSKLRRPEQREEKEEVTGTGTKEKKPGFLRRHPIAVIVGIVAVIALAIAAYFYWRNVRPPLRNDGRRLHRGAAVLGRPQGVGLHRRRAGHRQPACQRRRRARRIDERDYRIALEQAEAQVAAAKPASRISTRRSTCSRRRSTQAKAQVDQAQAAASVRAGRGGALPGPVENAALAPFRRPSSQTRSSFSSSRPTLSARRRP